MIMVDVQTKTRRRRISLLTAGAFAVAFANLAAPGSAGAAASKPTHVQVTAITSSVGTPAGAAGAPTALVQAGLPFSVSVELQGADDKAYPASTTKDTVLSIAVTEGSNAATFSPTVTTTATGAAGASAPTFPGLDLTAPPNEVQLTVALLDGPAALNLTSGVTDRFDVVATSELESVASSDRGRSLVVSKNGVDQPCEPVAAPGATTCVDLVLPLGVASDVFFSTGLCDAVVGCTDGPRDLLQVLADFGSGYGNTTPATLIFKCDKSLCPGKGVPAYELKVNLDATGDLANAVACRSKGVIPSGQTNCLDYRQSKRDGSGDLYLYWLVARDARGSCC
jgi:hypothetical protein